MSRVGSAVHAWVFPDPAGTGPQRVTISPADYAAALLLVGAGTVSLATASVLPALGVLAAVLLWRVFTRPRFAAVLVAVAWGGPLAAEYQRLPSGPLALTVGQVLLGVGVAGVLVRSRWVGAWAGPRRPFFLVPVALFVLAVGWGLAMAAAAGGSRGELVHGALAVLPLGAYFLLRSAYQGRVETLVRDLVWVCVISAVVVLGAIAVGFEPLIGRTGNVTETSGARVQALRIDPPLLRLLCVTLLLLVFARVPLGRVTAWRWPAVAVILVIEVLSLTRTTWVSLLAAWLVLPLLAYGWSASWRTVRRVVAAAAVILVLLTVAGTGVLGSTAQVGAARALSVTDADITSDSSLQDRALENEAALARIAESPVAGSGFQRPYGAYTRGFDPDLDTLTYTAKQFIHQSYLGTWMWLGLPGVVALVALAAAVVRALVIVARRRDRSDTTLPAAALGGLVALAGSSAFQTNLTYPPAYFAVAAALACLDLWVSQDRTPPHHPAPPAAARPDARERVTQ